MESGSARKAQRRVAPPELDRLELTVRRLIEAHDAWRSRAEKAEARIRELETAVQDVAAGRLDPVALAGEVERLQQQNEGMRTRMDTAYESVQRMLARLHFVEEER